MRTRLATGVLTLVSVVVLGVTTASCGGSAGSQPDQPASRDGDLVSGDFAGLPKPNGAFPLSDPSVDEKTITQSFKVVGSGPEQILGFLEVELPKAGWELRAPPTEVGDGDWQAFWIRDTETLEASVSPYNDNDTDTVTSQLDLVLTR